MIPVAERNLATIKEDCYFADESLEDMSQSHKCNMLFWRYATNVYSIVGKGVRQLPRCLVYAIREAMHVLQDATVGLAVDTVLVIYLNILLDAQSMRSTSFFLGDYLSARYSKIEYGLRPIRAIIAVCPGALHLPQLVILDWL